MINIVLDDETTIFLFNCSNIFFILLSFTATYQTRTELPSPSVTVFHNNCIIYNILVQVRKPLIDSSFYYYHFTNTFVSNILL